jgi:hypothetical protein
MEECQSSLRSGYDQLKSELDELHGTADTLEWEKSEIEKSYGAQVATARANFQKYLVQHRRRLHELRFDLENVLGDVGPQCFPYPGKGSTIGDIMRWFEGK